MDDININISNLKINTDMFNKGSTFKLNRTIPGKVIIKEEDEDLDKKNDDDQRRKK